VLFRMRCYQSEQAALNGVDALTAVKSGRFTNSWREQPFHPAIGREYAGDEAVPGALS
jgi:hypothetical protein